jgi:two-component system KDP operon response regulator KdpE
MQKSRVLVIDDELPLLRLVRDAFSSVGCQTYTAASGLEGLRKFYAHQPDLVILDLMMPEMDGWEVCRQIRQMSDVPLIFLSALSHENEIVRGLNYGADDYVTKPFSIKILLAQAKAVLRRVERSAPIKKTSFYNDGYLIVDLEAHRVLVQGLSVKLSRTEYRLLTYLLANSGQVLTFQQILTNIWGEECSENVEYVHTYVWSLRQKLEKDPQHPADLLTEHGMGYCFEKQDG